MEKGFDDIFKDSESKFNDNNVLNSDFNSIKDIYSFLFNDNSDIDRTSLDRAKEINSDLYYQYIVKKNQLFGMITNQMI
jgi:hypothetical protein